METKPKRIARTKVNDYTVNTCLVNDRYETAIKLEDHDYIIVQTYVSLAHAEIGHKHWSSFCETNPIYATDVVENKQKVF
jgi:hypothetical protein